MVTMFVNPDKCLEFREQAYCWRIIPHPGLAAQCSGPHCRGDSEILGRLLLLVLRGSQLCDNLRPPDGPDGRQESEAGGLPAQNEAAVSVQ